MFNQSIDRSANGQSVSIRQYRSPGLEDTLANANTQAMLSEQCKQFNLKDARSKAVRYKPAGRPVVRPVRS